MINRNRLYVRLLLGRVCLAATVGWAISDRVVFGQSDPASLRVDVGLSASIGCQASGEGAPAGFQAARAFDIGTVWSGTAVDFDAFVFKNTLFVAYYDADRYMTVAKRDLASGNLEWVRLGSRFEGWDSHNYIRLALDRAQVIHVAGNMHASPLVYFQGAEPLSIASMHPTHLATVREDRVTYPTFLGGIENDLALLYRTGVSGDGAWFIAQWDGKRWDRSVELFSDRFDGAAVSAYPSPGAADLNGVTHVAIVWRRTPDASTNFRVSYVRTTNFLDWFDFAGNRIQLPISPENSTVVDDTGPGRGLLNSAQISVDPQGRPAIDYTKYGPRGGNAIVVATPGPGGRWRQVIIAESDRKADISGGGTLPEGPGIHPLIFSKSGRVTIAYAFANSARLRMELDPSTLTPASASTPSQGDLNCYFRSHRSDLIDWHPSQHVVRDLSQTTQPIVGDLIWETQGSTKRDRPYSCTSVQPTACRPPATTLHFVYFPTN